MLRPDSEALRAGGRRAVCTSVCTPLDEATLRAAIDRVTAAIATADDDAIAELVCERRAMREELRESYRSGVGVDEQKRRDFGRGEG